MILILIQLLASALFLYRSSRKEPLNRFLIANLLAAALAILSKMVVHVVSPEKYNYTISSSMAFAALTYLFSRELLTGKRLAKGAELLCVTPFLGSVAIFVLLCTEFTGIRIFSPEQVKAIGAAGFFMRLLIVSLFIVADILLLVRYRRKRAEMAKSADYYLIGIFLLNKFVIVSILLLSLTPDISLRYPVLSAIGYLQIPIVSLCVIYYKIIDPLRKGFTYSLNSDTLRIDVVEKQDKYTKYEKSEEEIAGLKHTILTYLDEEKPYLNMDFTFEDMSAGTGIPKHELSFVLNQGLDISFYKLINQKRIAYFLNHIDSIHAHRHTILSLAMESGFNSKTTFNKHFKVITGKTPREYLKGELIIA
ncbi:MAG: helix-turn-helix domain-containing protein [Leadbetterella sp.]|nr:helix-turn-helix domain-containing protein [Leadbetterella sp.]